MGRLGLGAGSGPAGAGGNVARERPTRRGPCRCRRAVRLDASAARASSKRDAAPFNERVSERRVQSTADALAEGEWPDVHKVDAPRATLRAACAHTDGEPRLTSALARRSRAALQAAGLESLAVQEYDMKSARPRAVALHAPAARRCPSGPREHTGSEKNKALRHVSALRGTVSARSPARRQSRAPYSGAQTRLRTRRSTDTPRLPQSILGVRTEPYSSRLSATTARTSGSPFGKSQPTNATCSRCPRSCCYRRSTSK